MRNRLNCFVFHFPKSYVKKYENYENVWKISGKYKKKIKNTFATQKSTARIWKIFEDSNEIIIFLIWF